jgi:hypothetical protein
VALGAIAGICDGCIAQAAQAPARRAHRLVSPLGVGAIMAAAQSGGES